MSALAPGDSSFSTVLSGSPANSGLVLPAMGLASQTLVNPAPGATSTDLVMGISPQNIPEPRVVDMLLVLASALALRRLCRHFGHGVRAVRGFSIE